MRFYFLHLPNSLCYDFRLMKSDKGIESGELFQIMVKKGLKVHRDTFHATYGLGRYALGLLWYYKLTGNSVHSNTFSDFDEYISDQEIESVKDIVSNL